MVAVSIKSIDKRLISNVNITLKKNKWILENNVASHTAHYPRNTDFIKQGPRWKAEQNATQQFTTLALLIVANILP